MKSKCQCCDKVGPVTNTKSKIKRGSGFYLCEGCAAEKHEPRFWLILFGRSNGVRSIEKHAQQGLYCGPEILLREVL